MKKISIIFIAIFAVLFSSCALDEIFEEAGQTGSTTVTFTPDFGFSDEGPDTKAFTETPQNVKNLYLAVFNEGGKSLVEYVKAVPVTLATENDTKYTYTVTLKTSNKPRVIHFIANAPEALGYGSDVDAVGTLKYSFDTENWTGEDAYWGYLETNGIYDEKDARINALKEAMSSVKLVRNFAKIKVEAATGSNLTITRFWISNFPENSTAAPYNRDARRFETGYAGYDSASSAMSEGGYNGFCPAYSGLVSLSGLSDEKLAQIACGPGTARDYAYTYEREKPLSDPLCIIVGGTSDLPGGDTETFYKIDIRDNAGNYLPVLRNFTYLLKIGTVYKVGEATVEDALKSVSSGAIDTDLSLQGLKDLSNGKSRIAVSETERVLFDDEPFALLYSYIPDITTGTVVNKTLAQWVSEGSYASEDAVLAAHEPYVTIEFNPGKSGKVIDSFSLASYDETDGYRKISIEPVSTSDIIKSEVVTITGHVWNDTKNGYETLQRTVSYQMRPRLNMVLALTPDRVPMAVGESINLTIGIEENLPQSLFTLDMKITTEQMTLTPDSNDLPISSEVGADGKPTFFMTRAITWEEYSTTPSVMDADGILRKHFDCPFKTNTDNFRNVDESFGQGDKVLVSNENFNAANTLFIVGNDNLNRFVNPHLDKDYLVAGIPANIVFGMTKLPVDGTVYVRMIGIEPVDTEALRWVEDETGGDNDGYSVYELDVDNANSESFAVKTKTNASVAYFQLFDDEFNNSAKYELLVQKPSFTDLRFKYKNLDYVVAGKEALATFHMDYIPQDSLVTIHLKNAKPVDESLKGTSEANGYKSYVISVDSNDESFPVKIEPATSSETKAYFKLTANNYNDSADAESSIQKLNFGNLKLINVNDQSATYVIGGKPAQISFTLEDLPSSANGIITLNLNNLTIPDGAVMTNGSYTKIRDTEYQLTATGRSITIDAVAVVGQDYASYTLTNTEFYDGGVSGVEIKKLSFKNPKLINKAEPDLPYVIGGKPAQISFTLEDLPSSANPSITLRMTNLTPVSTDPTSGEMTGISSFDGSNGSYTFVPSGKNITINVTPTAGDELKASYTLENDEFKTTGNGVSNVEIKKLTFSNPQFNCPDGKSYLLAGGQASISFSVDQLPNDPDNKVTLYIKNATLTGFGTPGTSGDFKTYSVPVDSKTKTLNITVGTGSNIEAEFYLGDNEFYSMTQHAKAEIKTRYTIDWSKVLIKGKLKTTESPAKNESVEVYTTSDFSDEPLFIINTGADGKASGTDTFDSSSGTENFYFKFEDSIGEYKSSAAKTLNELTSNSEKTVLCQIHTNGSHKFDSGQFKVTLNGSSKFKGSVSWTTQSEYSGTITMGNNSGQNNSSATITCTDKELITFTCNGYTGQFTINQVKNGVIDLK